LTQEYPWYEVVEGDDLQQGDFIDDCQVLIPNYALTDSVEEEISSTLSIYQLDANADFYDVIIVSQSCDLENVKVDNVLVCPRWSYSEAAKVNPKFRSKDTFERIKKGIEYRYCFLDKCEFPDFTFGLQIVDFNNVFSIPYSVMKQIALSKSKRIRLGSPYREKLAQAFAYFHMRVALQNDLPGWDIIKPTIQASSN
jgi:hypothetical protein